MANDPIGFSKTQIDDAISLGQSMRDATLTSASSPEAVDLILGLLLQIDQNLRVLAYAVNGKVNMTPPSRRWWRS